MRVVEDRSARTISQFVRDSVAEGSTIWTDDNPAYNLTERRGYDRRVTVAKDDSDPLPTLGRVTTNLKRWLIGTHKGAVQPQHLQAYLNEYVFRFNRRDMPWIAFNRALGLSVLDRPAAEYEGLHKHTWLHPNPSEGPEQYGLWDWDEL
jgi:transposase-like protein